MKSIKVLQTQKSAFDQVLERLFVSVPKFKSETTIFHTNSARHAYWNLFPSLPDRCLWRSVTFGIVKNPMLFVVNTQLLPSHNRTMEKGFKN